MRVAELGLGRRGDRLQVGSSVVLRAGWWREWTGGQGHRVMAVDGLLEPRLLPLRLERCIGEELVGEEFLERVGEGSERGLVKMVWNMAGDARETGLLSMLWASWRGITRESLSPCCGPDPCRSVCRRAQM